MPCMQLLCSWTGSLPGMLLPLDKMEQPTRLLSLLLAVLTGYFVYASLVAPVVLCDGPLVAHLEAISLILHGLASSATIARINLLTS